jgi:hypothetical protein
LNPQPHAAASAQRQAGHAIRDPCSERIGRTERRHHHRRAHAHCERSHGTETETATEHEHEQHRYERDDLLVQVHQRTKGGKQPRDTHHHAARATGPSDQCRHESPERSGLLEQGKGATHKLDHDDHISAGNDAARDDHISAGNDAARDDHISASNDAVRHRQRGLRETDGRR